MKVVCLIVCLSTTFLLAESFRSGAPFQACSTLSPNPSLHLAQPQSSQVPYEVDISALADGSGGYCYTPGQTYSLTVRGSGGSGMQFRGFFVQARLVADDTTRVGVFEVTDSRNTKLSACNPSTDGITHTANDDKTSVSFDWVGPGGGTGPIRFGFAVVQVQRTYWANQRTSMIDECASNTPEPTTTIEVITIPPTDAGETTTEIEFDPFCFAMRTQQSAQCHQAYQDLLSGGFNETASDNFCGSECAPIVARDNIDCGLRFVGEQVRIQCAQDSDGNYCGTVQQNTSSASPVGMALNNAVAACMGASDCSGACRTAVEALGCCFTLSPLDTILPSIVPAGVLDDCNIQPCTPLPTAPPFTSSCPDASVQECNAEFVTAVSSGVGQQVRSFCSSECPGPLAAAYEACEDPSSPGLLGPPNSVTIREGCGLDNLVTGRVCGEALLNQTNQGLIGAVVTACNAADCSDAGCYNAIQAAGCCIVFATRFQSSPTSDILRAAITSCNVEPCPGIPMMATMAPTTMATTTMAPTTAAGGVPKAVITTMVISFLLALIL